MKIFISIISLILSICSSSIYAENIVEHIQNRLKQTWVEGKTDLYITGYAWHNRYTYRPEKIKEFNEFSYGGGLGKGFYDEDGDWHGLFAIGFADSHENFEPVIGYAYQKIFHAPYGIAAGLGFTVLVTARPDINHGYPFPGVLPWVSLAKNRFTLAATYIPGAAGAGNVLFVLGKYSLDNI